RAPAPRAHRPSPTRRSSDLAATATETPRRERPPRMRLPFLDRGAVTTVVGHAPSPGRIRQVQAPAPLAALPRMSRIAAAAPALRDRKSTRLNSSHVKISYAV